MFVKGNFMVPWIPSSTVFVFLFKNIVCFLTLLNQSDCSCFFPIKFWGYGLMNCKSKRDENEDERVAFYVTTN